jgi:hypothetical protein
MKSTHITKIPLEMRFNKTENNSICIWHENGGTGDCTKSKLRDYMKSIKEQDYQNGTCKCFAYIRKTP